MKKFLYAHALMLFAPLTVGCGAGVGSITGTVTFQNKPVASGTVVVVGSDLLPYYGNINDDGTYTVPKVPTGVAKIAVFSPGPDAEAPVRPYLPTANPAFQKKVPARVFRGDPQKWFPLPEKYRDFDTSGLSMTVMGEVNQLDLELD
jgi:hypothetical protein